ncbi:Lon protease family protein [Idiomarina tyrosinivorans]|uniref:endopeptidase La n=1 Tax=Idiomarina tyrosinivorans TaxID=1445662 RepID=A0A432ZTU2_9GAMM|nr:Lon protease family protein [Idiomarina tyrosinivorans]RUO81303.1 Lon protease family protein [Idiomarina tyrosinivorans]
MPLPSEKLSPPVSFWMQQMPEKLTEEPLAGQQRALHAVTDALAQQSRFSHGFLLFPHNALKLPWLQATFGKVSWQHAKFYDWLYFTNPSDPLRPLCVNVPSGSADAAITKLVEYLQQPIEQRVDPLKVFADFSTESFMDYCHRIKQSELTDFEDQPLASIIVQQQHPEPFIYCDRVTEASLFGQLGLQSIEGTVRADLQLIEPGALLRANGGVLVIDAVSLLDQPNLWSRLKHSLANNRFDWPQPQPEQGPAYFYRPQAVPLSIKVFLAGGRNELAQLREYDPDFFDHFAFLADYSAYYPIQQYGVAPYFGYLHWLWQYADVLPLTESGYQQWLKFSFRLAEFENELSLASVTLLQYLQEAHQQARANGRSQIDAEAMVAAEKRRIEREGLLADFSRRAILQHQVLIETEGKKVGQVNGLTVVSTGGVEFGEPSRITATVHFGDGDIIDIERKADLSGNIHTKGVMILSAYLANQFARHQPMNVSATVVFEQSYHEVDGDSASMGELCCLLSALAEVPLQQALAVTGAVDQFGQVQAIGAVNDKIEGYFELCKQRGLNGEHGVIIPQANVGQLCLNDDVQQAVSAGLFTIHAVETVEQAISLLAQQSSRDIYRVIRQQSHGDDEHQHWLSRIFRKSYSNN